MYFGTKFPPLLSILIAFSFGCSERSKQSKPIDATANFEVVVFRTDYAHARALFYRLSADSIKVVFLGAVKTKTDSIGCQKQRSAKQRDRLKEFIRALPQEIDSKAFLISTGEQLVFRLRADSSSKAVNFSGAPEQFLNRLITLINDVTPSTYSLQSLQAHN